MLSIHIMTLDWEPRTWQGTASFISHPVIFLYHNKLPRQAFHSFERWRRLQLRGSMASLWSYHSLMAKLGFEPRTVWVNYPLLTVLLGKIYSTTVTVESKCKTKLTQEKETCQRVTIKKAWGGETLWKVITSHVGVLIMDGYLPCNSLAVASEGIQLLYAERFWW